MHPRAMAGIFITFEGVEGCGKTTQIQMLARALVLPGRELLLTREPGGTPIGEKIRTVLLDAGHGAMSPLAELLLYGAARNQHVRELLRPALEREAVVLCDRYADATTAYQGAARRITPEVIAEVHRVTTEGLWPDLTIVLDLPPEAGLARARARNAEDVAAIGQDRFEREEMEFHERVRAGYLEIARREPGRIVVVDGAREAEAIHQDILRIVQRRFSALVC